MGAAVAMPIFDQNDICSDHGWRFQWNELIAVGSRGSCVSVTDRTRQKKNRYAMKVMPKAKLIETKSSIKRTLDELRFLQMLPRSGFIVNYRWNFQSENHVFIVLDLMEAGTLRSLLDSTGKNMSEGDARFYTACIVLALLHLHASGIIHRDVKPENIFIDSKG